MKPAARLLSGFLFACIFVRVSEGARAPAKLPTGTVSPQALLPGPPFPEIWDTLNYGPPKREPPRREKQPAPKKKRKPMAAGSVSPEDNPLQGAQIRTRPGNLPEQVRVLLADGAKTLSLYAADNVKIRGENPGEGYGESMILKGSFTVRRAGAKVELVREKRGRRVIAARRLWLSPANPKSLPQLETLGYRGDLLFLPVGKGLRAVNVVEVEDYLRGVLPYEMGKVDGDALEALKAQAIVARSYVYKRMQKPAAPEFHVYADVQDQMYKGAQSEYAFSDQAVAETRGLALCHGDSLALTYYHSTCGGWTSSRHEAWGGEPIAYLTARPDLDEEGQPYCQASRYSAWTFEWKLPKLAATLKRNLRSANVFRFPVFSRIDAIEILSRTGRGRVETLRIGTNRGPLLVKSDKVRWALRRPEDEEKILPSAWFDIRIEGNRAVAEGKGSGHGVGLCQMGAMERAREGQEFRQILNAYYKGLSLVEFE